MFACRKSMGLAGMEAYVVSVEADVSQGMPSFDIVGLPDASVREARDRVRSAMKNCGYDFPVAHVTINLAPADIKKQGPDYDLPIFIALLQATKQLDSDAQAVYIGELSLDGHIRGVNGVLPMVLSAKAAGMQTVFVPQQNAAEASVVSGIACYGVAHVRELIEFLQGKANLAPIDSKQFPLPPEPPMPDFSDVRGQPFARRAIEVAAAGGHNLLLIGPPGAGKSMLAKRIPSILPQMTFEECIQTTKLYSISGELPADVPLIRTRPFRAPHHTVSTAGLTGGGRVPKPGELSLAHNGVLFLDELPEFSRETMEILRQPLEDGHITISRVAGSYTYPCNVILVCAMNPCKCGYYGHPNKKCTCGPNGHKQYLSKISGPLLDRIDLHVEVPPVDYRLLSSQDKGESSAEIKQRVDACRAVQQKRYAGLPFSCNAGITPDVLRDFCPMTKDADRTLGLIFEKLGFSARAYDRILKVARTLADLSGSQQIDVPHIGEAIQFRSLDRKYWSNS